MGREAVTTNGGTFIGPTAAPDVKSVCFDITREAEIDAGRLKNLNNSRHFRLFRLALGAEPRGKKCTDKGTAEAAWN